MLLLLKVFLIYFYFGPTNAQRTNSPDDIYLQFYTTSKSVYTEIPIGKAALLLVTPGFVITKPTMFYWFGWKEQSSYVSVQTILSGYITRGDYNIVIVDWSNMNQGNYLFDTVFQRVQPAAAAFALCLNNLIKAGMNQNKYHIIGFGVGAHIAGLSGQYLTKGYNYLAPRITLLDPPGFGFWFFMPRADKSNAVFVDCIHTDAGNLGSRTGFGKANFWPNKGKKQPGCPWFRIPLLIPSPQSADGQCSHARAWAYYAESLTKTKNFAVRGCDFWKNPNAASLTLFYMGLETDLTASGDFCLRTLSTSPYGLGLLGAAA